MTENAKPTPKPTPPKAKPAEAPQKPKTTKRPAAKKPAAPKTLADKKKEYVPEPHLTHKPFNISALKSMSDGFARAVGARPRREK